MTKILSLFFRTEYFRNFVDSCLQKFPQDRPNSEELLKVRIKQIIILDMLCYMVDSCNHSRNQDLYFLCSFSSMHLSSANDQNRF